ncbi:MAG: phosphoenolpyruvate synthase [Deferribacteres bacterium]|nr:phosphoenolpyruvate synthase [Deferribacteres bacterium]
MKTLKMLIRKGLIWIFGFFCIATFAQAQAISDAEIHQLIQELKRDPRGPYQAIRWFCPDGTMLPPQERCPQPGGIQHALRKEIVQRLAAEHGIYFGQILAGTTVEEFLDAARQNSRLKQYQLEKFLHAVDDGWIMRRARFYRGAVQAEDEEAWGLAFLLNLAAREEIIESQYYLLRQAAKDIPHNAKTDRWQSIRAISQSLADSNAVFMDLRIKLHGSPDVGDIQRVLQLRKKYNPQLSSETLKLVDQLIADLEVAFAPFDLTSLQAYLSALPPQAPLTMQLKTFIQLHASQWQNKGALQKRCSDIAALLLGIRQEILTLKSAKARLAIIDLSADLENVLYRDIGGWEPEDLRELLQKNYLLAKAATGCGFLEIWEWREAESWLREPESQQRILYSQLRATALQVRRMVEWGTGMVSAHYQPLVLRFERFEPLAKGFIDDRIRASILLRLGEAVSQLSEVTESFANSATHLMDIRETSGARGLNPGFAVGELVVVTGDIDHVDFESDKIYIMHRTPDAMKPVAGIATVAEGNMVSHVQLLARNLGIPNAVLSPQQLNQLAAYSGQRIFYAVSPGGTVIMKRAEEMDTQEQALVADARRSEQKISVPLKKIDIHEQKLLRLKTLRAKDSGRFCGPKAANLGELKHLFPQHVVNGIVLPFGLFYAHMQQNMPGTSSSYWDFLKDIFNYAKDERDVGIAEAEIEKRTLASLAQLREAIKEIAFLPDFRMQLRQHFQQEFSASTDSIAVFIRSDTNMEDLKDFTGAGLNLTVFNVVGEEKILQGIRDVWASPYTERSYRWRQKYLINPENVYPSILIIPTVNVDKSGVMITTGVTSGRSDEVTVAFSRGAGGAVEGQAAESYLLRADGSDLLLAPAREMQYTLLPATGGTRKGTTSFERRLLTPDELKSLRDFSQHVRQRIQQENAMPHAGPLDIELGFFNDKLSLFQIRPYVENKRAQSTTYLHSLDPVLPLQLQIEMSHKLNKK